MAIDPTNLAKTATLTFSDDFNTLSLWNGTSGTWSTNYWFLDGWGGYSTSNGSNMSGAAGEQHWYINANYAPTDAVNPWTVSNGVLTIRAEPASPEIQPLIDNAKYTSGEINTFTSFSQTYGYFEMRAQLPAGQGLWPAFWLMPKDGSWPPELDVMEVLGHDMTTLYTARHTTAPGFLTADGGMIKVADMSQGFHTYGADWQADYITWYFDGRKVYQLATPPDMNKAMFIQANLAVGGNWSGPVDATTKMPADMKIDYIRAYKAIDDAPTTPAPTTPAPTTPAPTQPVVNLKATSGADLLTGTTGADTINAGSGNDTVNGGGGKDYLRGDSGNDRIDGGADFDDINGNAGDDFIFGAAGDDWAVGGQGNDSINGDDGADLVYGNLGNDTLLGGAGNDIVRGGQGADSLSGGAGNDWLTGDRDADTMSGGAGADTFYTFTGAGADRVIDFKAAEGDRVQVDVGARYTAHQVGADTVIDMSSASITLVGVSMSSLPSGWLFAA
ncbi:MAG: family 16 glycosylhydrolase [Phenylobacterium sp.]|uniref:family 16 glycosylhydrolase n=1 Tax=Phenylobacterium sp. TaxID=1871053 RepID=UPI002732E4FD|nr:family 16 glycosylhydrolase [Phenylobacterium sp.]MDP3175132.1 family 16 glycosylhydrolase [Phenylobacterium sp.]